MNLAKMSLRRYSERNLEKMKKKRGKEKKIEENNYVIWMMKAILTQKNKLTLINCYKITENPK